MTIKLHFCKQLSRKTGSNCQKAYAYLVYKTVACHETYIRPQYLSALHVKLRYGACKTTFYGLNTKNWFLANKIAATRSNKVVKD